MWVENPVRETYEEIKEKYKGYCALVTFCDKKGVNFGTGITVAYNESIAVLSTETDDYIENNEVGLFGYKVYTDFGDSTSPIQVVYNA